MADPTGPENTSGSSDPLVEALLREMIDETTHPKTARKTVTDVLTEELLTSLREAERTPSQAASLETVIVAEALAPELVEALAPALAEALVPALVKALQMVVAPKETAEGTPSQSGSD